MPSESFSPANLAAVAQQTTSFILGVTIAALIASLLVTNYMVWHSYLQVCLQPNFLYQGHSDSALELRLSFGHS
jgi:hypothetical protein